MPGGSHRVHGISGVAGRGRSIRSSTSTDNYNPLSARTHTPQRRSRAARAPRRSRGNGAPASSPTASLPRGGPAPDSGSSGRRGPSRGCRRRRRPPAVLQREGKASHVGHEEGHSRGRHQTAAPMTPMHGCGFWTLLCVARAFRSGSPSHSQEISSCVCVCLFLRNPTPPTT